MPEKDNDKETSSENDAPVIDETESDDTVAPVQYAITSFGADYDAEGMVKRLKRDDIFIPPFQRDYVWTQNEASRFIESLLLGLPVPGVFLARETDSKKLLVIDGQQRLKTLQYFFEGYFNPDPAAKSKRVFKLTRVQSEYDGLTYETLEDHDRVTLNDSIIHATIVKQDAPEGDQSSVYHIFERLNTSGRKLSPQQIRVAIYHGDLIDLIRNLNDFEPWREIFGRRSRTLKDQELILRFLSLWFNRSSYKRPMNEFLNNSAAGLIKTGEPTLEECASVFRNTISVIRDSVGSKAFRPERALNAAVFDSVMVGVASHLMNEDRPSAPEKVKQDYETLLDDTKYLELVSRATADEKNVAERIDIAVRAFA